MTGLTDRRTQPIIVKDTLRLLNYREGRRLGLGLGLLGFVHVAQVTATLYYNHPRQHYTLDKAAI